MKPVELFVDVVTCCSRKNKQTNMSTIELITKRVTNGRETNHASD